MSQDQECIIPNNIYTSYMAFYRVTNGRKNIYPPTNLTARRM